MYIRQRSLYNSSAKKSQVILLLLSKDLSIEQSVEYLYAVSSRRLLCPRAIFHFPYILGLSYSIKMSITFLVLKWYITIFHNFNSRPADRPGWDDGVSRVRNESDFFPLCPTQITSKMKKTMPKLWTNLAAISSAGTTPIWERPS